MDAFLFLALAAILIPSDPVAQDLRFATPPNLNKDGAATTWMAAVDCENPPPSAWIGARVVFGYDLDLDGVPEVRDTLGIPAADCGEENAGRIVLRRRLSATSPALLRAELQTPAGVRVQAYSVLTAGAGSLLALSRFCARPQHGEPEWIEVRNENTFPVSLPRIRFETRALSGTLQPDESVVAGSDTAELALWQPGARRIALSSWSSMRNSGDTLRLSLAATDSLSPGLVLDSIVYGAGASGREACASVEKEGSGAAASGFSMESATKRWRRSAGDWTVTVRAPASGIYSLQVFDLDGRPICSLAREAVGPALYRLPHASCQALSMRAGLFVLHLAPRAAPGVRTVIRITE